MRSGGGGIYGLRTSESRRAKRMHRTKSSFGVREPNVMRKKKRKGRNRRKPEGEVGRRSWIRKVSLREPAEIVGNATTKVSGMRLDSLIEGKSRQNGERDEKQYVLLWLWVRKQEPPLMASSGSEGGKMMGRIKENIGSRGRGNSKGELYS